MELTPKIKMALTLKGPLCSLSSRPVYCRCRWTEVGRYSARARLAHFIFEELSQNSSSVVKPAGESNTCIYRRYNDNENKAFKSRDRDSTSCEGGPLTLCGPLIVCGATCGRCGRWCARARHFSLHALRYSLRGPVRRALDEREERRVVRL